MLNWQKCQERVDDVCWWHKAGRCSQTKKNWYVEQKEIHDALDWNNGNRVKFIQGAKY